MVRLVFAKMTYKLLRERFSLQKGLLLEIVEYENAPNSFSFYPSSLGPLEIRDENGVLHIGSRLNGVCWVHFTNLNRCFRR